MKKTAALTLSDLQKCRLAERGFRWVATIKRLRTAADRLKGDEAAEAYAEVISALHMLGLALKHLSRCVEILNEAGETLTGAADFIAASKAVVGLRNALEHEEEYVAGIGRDSRLFSTDWEESGYFESNLMIYGSEGFNHVGFMGRTYNVRPAIMAALDLETALLALWNRQNVNGSVRVTGPSSEPTDSED